MKQILLSKSAFKVASTCPTKLYYYLQDYPSVKEENEYLIFLARDGHIVGKIAQLQYPNGIEIDRSAGKEPAVAETERLLQTNDNIVLFEAALRSGPLIAYVDILIKRGSSLSLIEVKSKGLDSADGEAELYGILGKKGGIDSNFRPYIEDVAFQYIVAKERFPDAHISCFLRAPDKSFHTALDDLPALFTVTEKDHVTFHGDPAALNAEALLIDAEVTAPPLSPIHSLPHLSRYTLHSPPRAKSANTAAALKTRAADLTNVGATWRRSPHTSFIFETAPV